MAYNVHNFKGGDKLYAAQLNEMDAQIAANTAEIEELHAKYSEQDIAESGVILSRVFSGGKKLIISGETSKEVTLIHHGKNFMSLDGWAMTSRGVTYTPNADGTLNVIGTADGKYWPAFPNFKLPAGTYRAAYLGLPTGIAAHLEFADGSNQLFDWLDAANYYYTFTLSNNTEVKNVFKVEKGVPFSAAIGVILERVDNSTSAAPVFEAYHGERIQTTLPVELVTYDGVNHVYTETADVLTWESEDEVEYTPVFTLPAKSVAVVGHEWNMYFHNIVDYMTEQYFIECAFSPSISSQKMFNDVLRITPTEDDIGAHVLTLRLYKKTGGKNRYKLCKSHDVNVHVISDASMTGKKVIFIGDSLTDNGIYPAEVQHNLSNGGIVSLGTRSDTVTIGEETLTVNHEGRSGWASYDYTRTRESYRTDADNPFWNESAGAFDFSYYMNTQGFDSVDVVCIGLGTNGVTRVEENITAIDTMIASIHAYDPNIKVIVSLITLPCTQDGCNISGNIMNSELTKLRTLTLNQAYMEKYQNVMSNVDVAELYFALDTKNDFNTREQPLSARNPQTVHRQIDNVHPSTYGYLKFADVWYNNILYHLAN